MTDFDDGKDESALRTIGEVSEGLGIKPHVLRYWEQQFKILKPLKRSGGRRYYRPEDVALIERIDQLVNQEGYTIKGAQGVLRASSGPEYDRRQGDRRASDRRSNPVEADLDENRKAAAPQAEERDFSEEIAKLKSIRARLASAIEA